jgi:hypothetical protein
MIDENEEKFAGTITCDRVELFWLWKNFQSERKDG